MSEGLLYRAGEAWAFRARVEREAARRFGRLAGAIREVDPGSPVPDMMERAASDETRHSALCAELAAAYGRPSDAELAEVDIVPSGLGRREGVLYEVVAACCLTETESVATLTMLLAADNEPRVGEILHEIARDEILHSRMGWAHLSRAQPAGVAFLAPFIPVMLAGGVDRQLFEPADADEPPAAELLRHGVLPRARKRDIFVATLHEVVFPGLERFGIDVAHAWIWLAGRGIERSPS